MQDLGTCSHAPCREEALQRSAAIKGAVTGLGPSVVALHYTVWPFLLVNLNLRPEIR